MPKKRSPSGRRAKSPAPRKRAQKRAPVLAAALAANRAKLGKRASARKTAVSVRPAPSIEPVKPSISVLPVPPVPTSKSGITTRSFAVLAMVLLFTITAGALIRVGQAATFQGPTNDPPQGNIPVTIWNRVATGTQQEDAAIDIDGYINIKGGGPPPAVTGITVGSATLDLGSAAAGQNLIYGVANDANMNVGDNLLLLQAPSGTDRLSVNKAGDLVATNVNASSCFGATFRGQTATLYYGDLDITDSLTAPPAPANGYVNVNAVCSAFGAGAHVCSSAEMMNSIKCSVPGSPMRSQPADSAAWMQDGPPGFTAPSNDCKGWTSQDGGDMGRIWKFNEVAAPATVIGRGYLTTCNQPVPFACCN